MRAPGPMGSVFWSWEPAEIHEWRTSRSWLTVDCDIGCSAFSTAPRSVLQLRRTELRNRNQSRRRSDTPDLPANTRLTLLILSQPTTSACLIRTVAAQRSFYLFLRRSCKTDTDRQ